MYANNALSLFSSRARSMERNCLRELYLDHVHFAMQYGTVVGKSQIQSHMPNPKSVNLKFYICHVKSQLQISQNFGPKSLIFELNRKNSQIKSNPKSHELKSNPLTQLNHDLNQIIIGICPSLVWRPIFRGWMSRSMTCDPEVDILDVSKMAVGGDVSMRVTEIGRRIRINNLSKFKTSSFSTYCLQWRSYWALTWSCEEPTVWPCHQLSRTVYEAYYCEPTDSTQHSCDIPASLAIHRCLHTYIKSKISLTLMSD